MLKPETIQLHTRLSILSDRHNWTSVILHDSHGILDRSPYCNRTQVWPQLRLVLAEKHTPFWLTHDADETNHCAVHQHRIGPQRELRRLPVKLENVVCGCASPYQRRRLLRASTDPYSAIAASNVQGFGLCACKHIRESGSHSPPNGKFSSWYSSQIVSAGVT